MQVSKDFDEGFLGRILSVLAVPQHVDAQIEDSVLIGAHDLLKSGEIILCYATDRVVFPTAYTAVFLHIEDAFLQYRMALEQKYSR